MRRGSTASPSPRGGRLRALAAGLVLALAATLAAAPASDARRVRVFAVSPKLDLSWHESRQAFRAKIMALTDRTLRDRPGTPLVQAGADDVVSHLVGPEDPSRPVETARDLVVWPEDAAFFSMLAGPRAEQARRAPDSQSAIASLLASYGPQVAHYERRYPELAGRAGGRALLLALTDVHVHVGLEVFAELADRHDVYLQTASIQARDWQVVCVDREAFDSASPPRLPGGVRCDEESPDKVALLGEPGRDYAYEATSPRAATIAFVFDPDGRLISKQVKTYLVPIELGQAEGIVGLDAVPGEVTGGLPAVETPVGTLGFVISKDSWMPDVSQKLDQAHVDLLVQPEFFVGDVVSSHERMWAPDTLKGSGWSSLLRQPSFETLALPELSGNLYDLSADAQGHIGVKPRTGREPAGHLVGQPPAPGLAEVMPWVVPDPLAAGEPFAERRARLAQAGRALLPGSGVPCEDPARPGPCENGHVEGVLWRDVEVARRPRRRPFRGRRARTAFTPSAPVSPSRHPQRNAAVARRGRRVLLAFEERRGGRDGVWLVRSGDGGRTWSRRVRPTGRPHGAADEWWPAVALGPGGRATVAWVDTSAGGPRVFYATSRDGGRTFSPPVPIDPSPAAAVAPGPAQWRPALAQGAGDVVHAAFVDERDRQADDGLPQAGLWYTRIVAGAAEPARRLDGGTPAPLATKLDNAWAPGVAARGGRVLVSWIDFRTYDWDVYARSSADGGESFGEEVAVNATPERHEALNDSPQPVLGPSRAHVAWADWRKRDGTGPQPHPQHDVHLATPGAPASELQVDGHGGRQVSTFAPAACAAGDDVLVAWQDHARGQADVRVARVAGGDRRGRVRRVDDAGRAGGNAWRPRLACWGGSVLAAWEDERDGPAQVYAALTRADRLR